MQIHLAIPLGEVLWKSMEEGKKVGKSLFGRPLKQHDTHIARHHIQLQTFIVLCKEPREAG